MGDTKRYTVETEFLLVDGISGKLAAENAVRLEVALQGEQRRKKMNRTDCGECDSDRTEQAKEADPRDSRDEKDFAADGEENRQGCLVRAIKKLREM